MTLPTGSSLSVAITSDRHGLLVAPCGELDRETVPMFAHCIDGAVEVGCSPVRVNLSGISFLDIAGYRALVRFCERCHGCEIIWVRPSSSVRLVFHILGEPHAKVSEEVSDSASFDGVAASA
jgi:anti-anti-sigma factor